MVLKRGDFIQLDYVGRVKSTNKIFDLTNQEIAKENNLKGKFEPVTICVGEGHVLKGIDTFLEGKELNKEYSLEIQAKDAFGERNPKLVQLTGLKKFKDKNIMPYPGLQLDIDGAIATVRSVSGGRVIVDLNHPLAGKELTYKIKLLKIVTDSKEQLQCIAKYDIPFLNTEIELKESTAKIKLPKQFPKQFSDKLKQDAERLIKDLKVEIV